MLVSSARSLKLREVKSTMSRAKIQAQALSIPRQHQGLQAAFVDSLRRGGWCQAVLWAGSRVKDGPG